MFVVDLFGMYSFNVLATCFGFILIHLQAKISFSETWENPRASVWLCPLKGVQPRAYTPEQTEQEQKEFTDGPEQQ